MLQTGWSSASKLQIYVNETTTGCYGGSAIPGESQIYFSNPLYRSDCLQPYGIGELEDKWEYMGIAIDETLHSINPDELFIRSWLTQGFSEYFKYNILVDFNDINQTTADNY